MCCFIYFFKVSNNKYNISPYTINSISSLRKIYEPVGVYHHVVRVLPEPLRLLPQVLRAQARSFSPLSQV